MTYMSGLGIDEGFDGDGESFIGLNDSVRLIDVEQTFADVAVLRLGEEMEVGIALREILNGKFVLLGGFVFQIAKIDGRLA